MPRPTSAAAVLLAVLSSPDAAPAAEPAPEVVKLRFAWPAGAEAKVTYSRERTRTGKEPVASKVTYTERVERRGEEIWMFSSGMVAEAVEVPGLSAAEGAAVAAELARATEGMARVVGADGAFRRVEGLERGFPALLAVLEKRLPAGQREVAQRVGQTLRPVAAASSQAHWAYAVESWAGKDLDLGYDYESTSRAESPLAPGHPVNYRIRLGVVRRLPCEGSGPPRCVEATMRSTPDPAEIPGMIEAMTRRLLAQAAPGTKLPEGPLFREVDMADEIRLVTDPSTLLPRSLAWTRSIEFSGPDGKRVAQRDVKSWSYAWKVAGK